MIKKESDNISIMFDRAKIFFDRKIDVHISASRNGYNFFYNGQIKEINPKFIILEEKRVGTVPVQFSEICDIEKFIDKENGNANNI